VAKVGIFCELSKKYTLFFHFFIISFFYFKKKVYFCTRFSQRHNDFSCDGELSNDCFNNLI